MKKVIGIAAGILVLVAAKFLVPMMMVEAENASGVGWNDAKAEIRGEFAQVINREYAVFQLPPTVTNQMLDCMTDKAVAFLNGSGCSYYYVEGMTTESEHLANQEKCLAEAKYDAEEEKLFLQCMKAHFPNDWKHMNKTIIDEFTNSFSQEGMTKLAAQTAATCISGKLVPMLNTRKCSLINSAATKGEDLLNIGGCIPDPATDPEFNAVITECVTVK